MFHDDSGNCLPVVVVINKARKLQAKLQTNRNAGDQNQYLTSYVIARWQSDTLELEYITAHECQSSKQVQFILHYYYCPNLGLPQVQ